MKLKTRLSIQWLISFLLILLPVFVVVGLFFIDKMLSQIVLAGLWVVAVVGTVVAVKTVEKMRGLRDDERTIQWLDFARRRDASTAVAEGRDQANEKLVDELRGGKDARLPAGSGVPKYWFGLDDAALQSQVVRLLKKLGRRVQRSGDSAGRGFDLVVDNNAIVRCGAGAKGEANRTAQELLMALRANPTCVAAIVVWPKGFPAKTRYLARGSNLILWDADNIARLVKREKLA